MKTIADLQARLDGLAGGGESVERVDALNDLNETFLFAQGGVQKALALSGEAIDMARRLGHARGEARALFLQGSAQWMVSRLEAALATLLEAEACFRQLDDADGRAKVRMMVGCVYRSLGDLDQAFLEGLQAVEHFSPGDDEVWKARGHLSIAPTCHELGDYEAARKHCERVLELREDSDEQWVVGRALLGIGSACDALGDHREALRYHLRALRTCEAAGFHMGEARALHEIGHSHERLGDKEKAFDFYHRGLRLREEIDQREAQCTSLIALGRLRTGDDPDDALAYLRRALEVAKRVGAKPRIHQAHLALSEAYEARGDLTEALAHYQEYHRVHREVLELTDRMHMKNLKAAFEAEKKEREAEIARLKERIEEGGSLGSYHLTRKLGSGAMGDVWEGEHRLLARPAAIKVIRARTPGRVDERLAQRFRREAEVTAGLRSPHTVQLFDFGISDGGTFHYVMELLEGMDLRQMVERFGPLPPERVVYLLRQACRSLAEAHEAGLVHRDIKPANLFVCVLGGEPDFLKVLDFGIVKTDRTEGDIHLTTEGVLVGTPAFVAPEMVTGDAVDGRADLYSLGCTAFWLLTGLPVFDAKTPTAILTEHVRTEPPPVSRLAEQQVPEGLERLIAACLAKEPGGRPGSARALEERLREVDCGVEWGEERAREWWGRCGGGKR